MSSSRQPRRYRLVDQHGQPHQELDEHFDSSEDAWTVATSWCQQQQPTDESTTQVGLGLEVSTESGSWRLRHHYSKVSNHLHVQLLLAHGHNRLNSNGWARARMQEDSPRSEKKARSREIARMYERLPQIKPTSAMVTLFWAL